MTRPTATCELFVDGTRVPDTGPDLVSLEPTALDDLTLTWGRDGVQEQPGPATCSFTILDQHSSGGFLDRLHVGSTVAVWAQGEIPNPGTGYTQTMDDGTFDTWPLGDQNGVYYSGNIAGVATVVPYEGRGQVIQYARGTVTGSGIQIPPRKFSPTDTLPDAWDSILKYTTRAVWQFRLDIRGPAGLVVNLNVAGWKSPYVYYTVLAGSGGGTFTTTGDWQSISVGINPTAGFLDSWLGLYVKFSNLVAAQWVGQTTTWEDQTTTWDYWFTHLDNGFVGRPAGGDATRRVLVFSGSVTDVVAQPDGADGLELAITSADKGADLGNRVIGDVPWPVQTLNVRANKISQLAGVESTSGPRIRIDAPLGDFQVSYRDVDAQPALGLLQDLAQTGGGIFWAATHATTGPFLWIENPANRVSLAELSLSGGQIVITGQTAGATLLSACDLLEEPVRWIQDTQDVSTVVAVTWQEQGVDDDGLPVTTERTETITDTAGVATYGTRRLSIGTDLVNATDAQNLASRALAQARAIGWRVEGLTWDTDSGQEEIDSVSDTSRVIALLNALDGTTRMGLGLTVVDLPDYAPRGAISSVYLEGGTYRYAGGAWELVLTTTPAVGQGSSVTWGQIDPTWTWAQWSPSLTWQDLYGVAA